jgi:trans-2,3-dihydro-3-hydroxyanthranilate isomerase
VAELDFVKVDVFAEEAYSGNPAGIVFEADGLDEMQMQRIAFEIGSPITSFVLRSKKADVRLRFFSPTSEEPLSGHGTIGALWSLAERRAFGSSPGGKRRMESQVGVLPFFVEKKADGLDHVWMTQRRPMFAREGDEKDVASALGIGVDALFHDEFPLSRTSTGVPYLLVPVKSIDIMGKVEPKHDEICALSRELDVAGIEVYSWSVLDHGSTVHARCFLPSTVVLENPASGMAAGALGAYLVENDFIPREEFGDIVVEQGHWIGRPSKIAVRVEKRGSTIRRVEVGGPSGISCTGRLVTP